MAQGGDPKGDGTGGSAKPNLPAEFTFLRGPEMPFIKAADPQGQLVGFYKTLPIVTQPDEAMSIRADGRAKSWGLHCPGIASMARGRDPGSANSQFFLMRAPYPTLDQNYTIWGRAVWGQPAIDALKVRQPYDPSDTRTAPNPPPPDVIVRMRVASDLPLEEQAPIYLMRTESARFLEEIDAVRRRRGADFSVCDVSVPVRVPEEMLPQEARRRPWWRGVIPFF
jgi:peptidylprolyl isomerase